MYRYMISPIIGSGTTINPFRSAVSDVPNVASAAIIPTHPSGPNIGLPRFNFALCLCATSLVSAIEQVSNSYIFPDYNLDGRMDGMEAGARAGMVQSLEAYDLDGAGLHFDATHSDSDSYRSLILSIGQQLEPAFSIHSLNVAEVSG